MGQEFGSERTCIRPGCSRRARPARNNDTAAQLSQLSAFPSRPLSRFRFCSVQESAAREGRSHPNHGKKKSRSSTKIIIFGAQQNVEVKGQQSALNSEGCQAPPVGRRHTNCFARDEAGEKEVAAGKAGEKPTTRISANALWASVIV